jgi:hypothetical protein
MSSGELGRWVALAGIPVYAIFLYYVWRDRNVELADAATRRRSKDSMNTPA